MRTGSLVDIALPWRCARCGTWGTAPLCIRCLGSVHWIGDDACARCGSPARARCIECAGRAHSFDGAASAALYDGPMKDAIIAFKVLGERRLARAMSSWLTAAARRLPRPDAITWVPGTRRSEIERGFVPAEELARSFARLARMTATRLLVKERATADQHALSVEQRAENLRGAFRTTRPSAASVLLIDDVLTTGATADACALELKRGGAKIVNVLTIARSPLRGRQANAKSPIPRAQPGD